MTTLMTRLLLTAALLGTWMLSPGASAATCNQPFALSSEGRYLVEGDYDRPGRGDTLEEQERMQRWQSLPPEKREQLRRRYEKFRQLPPEEQEAVKQRYSKWREMPPEERRAMRDKWQSMSPEDRKTFRRRFRDEGDDRRMSPEDEHGRDGKYERKEKKDNKWQDD